MKKSTLQKLEKKLKNDFASLRNNKQLDVKDKVVDLIQNERIIATSTIKNKGKFITKRWIIPTAVTAVVLIIFNQTYLTPSNTTKIDSNLVEKNQSTNILIVTNDKERQALKSDLIYFSKILSL
jgi:hypothetical protein